MDNTGTKIKQRKRTGVRILLGMCVFVVALLVGAVLSGRMKLQVQSDSASVSIVSDMPTKARKVSVCAGVFSVLNKSHPKAKIVKKGMMQMSYELSLFSGDNSAELNRAYKRGKKVAYLLKRLNDSKGVAKLEHDCNNLSIEDTPVDKQPESKGV